ACRRACSHGTTASTSSARTGGENPFALSLSKGLLAWHDGFDKLSPNGGGNPFTLSPSKGLLAWHEGFDKLSPNGGVGYGPNGE
ncbi:hypothetical protein, partial [Rhizobacter sp. OV335]|uniref:hypothetical protein n=1 Tax=Rhizobacter sp. OV335 TaxID=1500264 RepID=UPI000911D175